MRKKTGLRISEVMADGSIREVYAAPAPASWRPEVFIDGSWSANGLRFATRAEAESSARALLMRWFVPSDSRAAESTDAPNYRRDADGTETRL